MASWLQIGWYTGKVFSQCISYLWGTGNVLSIYLMYCTSRISDLTYHMTIQILCPKCDSLNVKFNVWVPFSVKARPARIFACLKILYSKVWKRTFIAYCQSTSQLTRTLHPNRETAVNPFFICYFRSTVLYITAIKSCITC